MSYDNWKTTEPDPWWAGEEPPLDDEPEPEPDGVVRGDNPEDDFCVIHGFEHMRSQWGNPVRYCAKCEQERDK